MLFEALAASYLISSGITFLVDIFKPEIRVDRVNTGKVIMEYSKIVKVGMVNIISSYPLFFLFENYIMEDEELSAQSFVIDFIGWLLITDIAFYTFHRLLHLPRFYKYHKLHHEYKMTYGPGAIYSSMTEFYLSNVFPNALACYILSLSKKEMTVIIIFETFYTVIVSHGGYIFAENGHLKHHITFKEPYGLLLTDHIANAITS